MNILIFGKIPLFRYGIKKILITQKSMDSIFETSTQDGVMDIVYKNNIGLVITNLDCFEKNKLDLICKLKKDNPEIKIIAFVYKIDKISFNKVKNNNIDGIMLLQSLVDDLAYGIKLVKDGRKYIDPNIIQLLTYNSSTNLLTPRESAIMIEVSKGYSNSEIADRLYISEYTVKKHITSILNKLDLKNRTEIALYKAKEINNEFESIIACENCENC